jgi:hypothetical protein|tara:strand:+ start:903 stop:1118 length:216 start_codon:yes stop_codon:yes gene_type:complete
MNNKMLEALEKKYKAQKMIAKTNLSLYLSNPVAVAEHPDVVDTIDKLFRQYAEAVEYIEILRELDYEFARH